MFDNIKCEYPLPDANVQDEVFQTKAFGDGFTGGFLDNYTITKDGKLIRHNVVYEVVPEEDRPYYGTPEWKNPLLQVCGSMKAVPAGDEDIEYHGFMNMYTTVDDEWYEYEIKFTDGKIGNIKRIYKEYGK